MIRIAFILIFAIAALILVACGGSSNQNVVVNSSVNSVNTSPAHTPLPSATIDELASGRRVYAATCVNCHKEDGTGGEMVIDGKKINPDDLTSAKIKGFSDDKILGYIMNGIEDEGMPAFKGKLSEGEMRDVVKFIRAEIQKMPAATTSSPKS